MPPDHWVRLRHRSSDRATSSGVSTVEAPVVVYPPIDSKKASAGPIRPERRKGVDPTAATEIQPSTTIRKTSLPKMRAFGLRVSTKATAPTISETNAGRAKSAAWPSPARSA